jgi:hypothetical protein
VPRLQTKTIQTTPTDKTFSRRNGFACFTSTSITLPPPLASMNHLATKGEASSNGNNKCSSCGNCLVHSPRNNTKLHETCFVAQFGSNDKTMQQPRQSTAIRVPMGLFVYPQSYSFGQKSFCGQFGSKRKKLML